MDTEQLRHRFAYHPPPNEHVKRAHEDVRAIVGNVADELNVLLPEGREKSLVMTHLEEAMMWANAAIARSGGN